MMLQPCPFCGGEARPFVEPARGTNSITVACTKCNASVGSPQRWEARIAPPKGPTEDTPGNIRAIFGCGQSVIVGGVIQGVVEEVIFGRDMAAPLYLVEWWHDGDLRGRRFHESDLEAVK